MGSLGPKVFRVLGTLVNGPLAATHNTIGIFTLLTEELTSFATIIVLVQSFLFLMLPLFVFLLHMPRNFPPFVQSLLEGIRDWGNLPAFLHSNVERLHATADEPFHQLLQERSTFYFPYVGKSRRLL